MAYIHRSVRYAHTNVLTIHDNAERTTESVKSETKVFV
jgi:hypothetical protein